ncbi:MAG TPA: response regulator [Chitinophagaceae bacterium]
MKQCILLLEDNDFIRENTVEILELSDYEVVAVSDGVEGFRMFQMRRPDLILCDIQMPEMNGYDFLREVRKNEDASSIPFIFFTAFSEKKEISNAFKMGAADYIIKPFDADELLRIIEKHLSPMFN